MRKMGMILGLLAAAFFSGYWQGCAGDSANSDCEEFNPPAKTEYYGQSCGAFYYGTCPTRFDDCAQGTCEGTANGSVCTKTCSTNSDCPGGLSYCVANNSGAKVCTASCVSHTFCDGTLCCSYGPDPNNPTQCRQLSCAPALDSLFVNQPLLSEPVDSTPAGLTPGKTDS